MTPIIDENKALEVIKAANNILITPSDPDGDSIGTALALNHVLKKIGKKTTVISTNEVPDYLKFLPFVDQIEKELTISNDFIISLSTEKANVDHLKYEVKQDKIDIIITPKSGAFTEADLTSNRSGVEFDLIITVDTGDLVQLGKLHEDNPELFKTIPVLNIDHHASNGKFGTYNFLNYKVAATTQMLTPLLMQLEKEHGQKLIEEDVATLLLVGIITDTGSFQHSNTSPEAFEVAADLLERGARQQEIIKEIFKTKSLATLKLWGRVLSKITYDPVNKLVYSSITQEDLKDTGAKSEDSGGIIDELMSNAPDAEVVLLLKEKETGFVSGSLRAPGKLADVSKVAGLLGGGGHKKAAGFRIRDKAMPEALELAQSTIAAYMQEKLGSTNSELANSQEVDENGHKLFPGLVVKPENIKPTSLPKVSPGGEDLLLADYRKRQMTPEQEKSKEIEKKAAAFFRDADGQVKPNPNATVGAVLQEMPKL